MASSPGFGSWICHGISPYSGSLSLRLRPLRDLTKATYRKLVGSFFNRNGVTACAAPPPCKRMVSDTISSPSRAAFQRSITVLVHYRSRGVFSLGTSSCLLPTRFLGPRCTLDLVKRDGCRFIYRAITVFGSAFQRNSTTVPCLFVFQRKHVSSPCNPHMKIASARPPARGITCVRLGAKVKHVCLGSSRFARHY